MKHLSDKEVEATELQVEQIRSRVEALRSLYKASRQERRQLQNYKDDVSRERSKINDKVRSWWTPIV
jgi:chromosome segregation ATPase